LFFFTFYGQQQWAMGQFVVFGSQLVKYVLLFVVVFSINSYKLYVVALVTM